MCLSIHYENLRNIKYLKKPFSNELNIVVNFNTINFKFNYNKCSFKQYKFNDKYYNDSIAFIDNMNTNIKLIVNRYYKLKNKLKYKFETKWLQLLLMLGFLYSWILWFYDLIFFDIKDKLITEIMLYILILLALFVIFIIILDRRKLFDLKKEIINKINNLIMNENINIKQLKLKWNNNFELNYISLIKINK